MRSHIVLVSKHLSLILFFTVLLFIAVPKMFSRTSTGSNERIGAWNRYLQQTNVIECSNQSDLPVRARFTIRGSNGNTIRIEEIAFSGHASYHYILDAFTSADSYGTYSVELLDGDLSLQCTTLIYGMQDTSPRFSYSLPLLSGYSGNVFGFFNSFNPTASDRPIANWLALYNPGSDSLSLDVLIYNSSGELEQTIPVVALAQYQRTDIALGHSFGQKVGSYEIRPHNPTQSYNGYLARFAFNDTGVSTAYSLLPLAGSGIGSVVGTSTMENALNWLEIGNTSNSQTSVLLTLSSQTGTVLRSEKLELQAHSQQHVFVNEVLGPLAIGKAEIQCLSSNCKPTDTVFQSLYYGIKEGQLHWAYGSQGLPQGTGVNQKLDFSVNTFLNTSNWLKLISPIDTNIETPLSVYHGSGQKRNAPPTINIRGTSDIALHEFYGKDSFGSVSVGPQTEEVTAELIRVLPGNVPGNIQYINPIRSITEYENAFAIARKQSPNSEPGILRGSIDSIERKQVIVDGKVVEKIFARGWSCRNLSSAPIAISVKSGDTILGSGIANSFDNNFPACPGSHFNVFEFELSLPSDINLIGAPLSAIANDKFGGFALAQKETTKNLSPSLLFTAFDNLYPKGIFFRAGGLEGNLLEEGRQSNPTQWERDLTSLDGAFAHVADDAYDTINSQPIAEGLHQLAANPDQLVLAQFSGVGMVPTTVRAEQFDPQDWLYYAGCDSVGPVGNTAINIQLPEECFSRFSKCLVGPNTGYPRAPDCNPENLVAVTRNDDNSLDWSKAEYLIVDDLKKIDVTPSVKRTQITVKRGQFGRPALPYPHRVYLAAISHTGPWAIPSPQIVWNFNFHRASTRRHLTSLIASYFKPNGLLHGLDGLTLDVSWWYTNRRNNFQPVNKFSGKQIDINTDGEPDGGYAGTVNLYGKGVSQFHEQLRQALGTDKIILADGGAENSSRDFHVLNGSENEGFGGPQDANFSNWSTGVNLLSYTQNRTTNPQFKYVVHKNAPGASSARLVMASSQALEAAFANIVNPVTDIFPACTATQWNTLYNRSGLPVLDEMIGGTAHQTHWLGKPIEQLRRPGVNAVAVHPDNVVDLRKQIVRISDEAVGIAHQKDQTILTPRDPAAPEFGVSVPGLKTANNRDFTLSFEIASLGDLDGFTGNTAMPRMVKAITSANILPATGSSKFKKQSGLFGRDWSQVVFYFRNEEAQDLQFNLVFEGTQPVAIRNVKLTHTPDILIRRFERGLVIANPSYREYTFRLSNIYPGKVFKRLTATPCQATEYNDGRTEGETVIIPPKDGLFLIDVTP